MYRSQMFGPTGMALTALLILTSSLIQASSQVITVNFTVTPGNLTVAETSTANITYNCSVQVDPMNNRILQRHWSLQFPDTPGSFSTMDFDNSVALLQRGITYDEVTSSLTVQSVMGNNGTLLRCTVRPNGITEFSEPVQLTLAGPPLPPSPVLEILCASQIEVRWNVPYSNENFPVENYTIWISNLSSNAILASNDTMQNSFIYELVGTDQAASCHPLNFSVAAINSVGMSGPGMIRGGFPIAPLRFESEIKVAVTFLRDGTPVAEISFEAPFICDFQTSSYTIEVEDTSQPESPVVVFERTDTYTGRDRMIVEVINSQLATNSNYVVTVRVSDESYDGNVTESTIFDTAFVLIGNRVSPGVEGIEIYAGVAGGLVALLLISITLVAMVFIYTRRRKHHTQAPGSTMDKRLNNSISNRPDQLDNDLFIIPPRPPETTPAHAATPVYEAINEYQVNQEEARNTAALSRQWQDYRKLQQLDRERTQKDELEDSTYQVMNSASQDTTGASNLPSYPGHPPQLHANNDHPVTWPSQGASNQPHTPDNNYPYRYHFRPIPPSSAAALLVSPPARDRQNDPNFQYYTVNQTFGDAPAPPIDQEEEDEEAIGGGGGGGRVGYGGGEQDYTFMSEAGTLAGLTTERSNSVSQPRKMRIGVPGIDKNLLVSEC